MKVDNPRKTSSGCVHQTSARIVSPNERRGSVAVVDPFIRRSLLPRESSLFSTLPSCPAHSRVRRNLPLSKCSQRCWRDNHFRNKPQLVSLNRVRRFACEAQAEKCGAHRGRVPFSPPPASAHRQSASSLLACSVRG